MTVESLLAAGDAALARGRWNEVEVLVSTEVASTPLGERISQEACDRIRDGASEMLAPFTTGNGELRAPFECQVIVGTCPAR